MCPKCGTIEKSDKLSCCGRGGSWFNNCGRDSNSKFDYTWYEGIQACKTLSRSTVFIVQQLHAVEQARNRSSNCSYLLNSKSVITAGNTFRFKPTNTPTAMSGAIPITTPVYTQTNAPMNSSTRMPIIMPMSLTASAQSLGSTSTAHDKVTATATISAPTNWPITASVNTPMITPDRASAVDTLTHMSMAATTHALSSMAIVTKGCEMLLKITAHISLLTLILF